MLESSTTYYFGLALKYVTIPQHGSLSTYTKLEGPSIAKLDFYFPAHALWMIFKELLDFHGHGLSSMCKVAPSNNSVE
jgi:hypothetical protein